MMRISNSHTPLLTFCYYLGILPWYDRKLNQFRLNRPFTAAIFMAVVLVFVLQVYNNSNINLVMLTYFTWTSFVLVTIYKSTEWTDSFFCKLEELELSLLLCHGVKTPNVEHSSLKFATLQLIVLFIVGLNIWVNVTHKWGYYTIILRIVHILYVGNVFILQLFMLECICNVMRAIGTSVNNIKMFDGGDIVVTKLKTLTHLHWCICEGIYNYNRLFGWITFLQTISSCINILRSLLLILSNPVFLWLDNIGSMAMMALFVVSLFLYAVQAEKIKAEFDSLSQKADNLLHRFVDCSHLNVYLSMFSQQTKSKPQLTAANFLPVDYSMIVTLFGLFSTFIVLIVQYVYKN